MSSTRILTARISWDYATRAIELLDWETKTEDFDRLCDFIIDREVKRAQITRERLFEVMSEPELRKAIWAAAEAFSEEKHKSLVLYVGARLRWLVLPKAACSKKSVQ